MALQIHLKVLSSDRPNNILQLMVNLSKNNYTNLYWNNKTCCILINSNDHGHDSLNAILETSPGLQLEKITYMSLNATVNCDYHSFISMLSTECSAIVERLKHKTPKITQLAGRVKMRLDCIPQVVQNKLLSEPFDSEEGVFERISLLTIMRSASQQDLAELDTLTKKTIIDKQEKTFRDYYTLLTNIACNEIVLSNEQLSAENLIIQHLLKYRLDLENDSIEGENDNICVRLKQTTVLSPEVNKARCLLSDTGLFNDCLSPHFPPDTDYKAILLSKEHNTIDITYQYNIPADFKEKFILLLKTALYCSALDEDYQIAAVTFTNKMSFVYTSTDIYNTLFKQDKIKSKKPSLGELQEKYKAETDKVRPTASTTLRRAAAKGCCEDIEYLIQEYEADVNGSSSNGLTPLDWAYKNNHLNAVNTLCWFGADQSTLKPLLGKYVHDDESEFPTKNLALCRAAARGHDADIKILISKYEANLNAGDERKRTPLQLAQANNHLTTMELLTSLLEERKQIKQSTPSAQR